MDDTELARAKIAETLNCMLAGQGSYIEGARIVVAFLSDKAGCDGLSEPFVTFAGIESETDDVPIGAVRDQWSSEAVAKHHAE